MNIENLSIHFINQTPHFLTFSDLNSNYIRGNKASLDWLGIECEETLIGKTYRDLPCKASEQHETFMSYDNVVLNNGYTKIFGIYGYANNSWKIILAEKFLLKDEKLKPTSIVTLMSDLTYSNIVDIGKLISLNLYNTNELKLEQKGYIIGSFPKKGAFSQRQLECMFFLLRGKTAKQISQFLNLSRRTIETYIEQMKRKLDCTTKSQLIEKAIFNGYMNYLPESIFHSLR